MHSITCVVFTVRIHIPFDCTLLPFPVDTLYPNRQHHHPIKLLRDILCHLSERKQPSRVELDLPKTLQIGIEHLRYLTREVDPLGREINHC